MREIKFRGKTQWGEWIEGSYIQTDDSKNNPMQHHPLTIRHQMMAYFSGDWNMGGWSPVDVIPETVGQFTGILDRNKKEIFEGDIVRRVNGDSLYTVEFGHGCFIFRSVRSGYYFHSNHFLVEIIGNVIDKPELLKGEIK